MYSFKVFSYRLSTLAIALILVSCASTPPPDEKQPLEEAVQLADQGKLREAATIYWQQAQQASPPQRQILQLRALETVLTPETRETAKDYLARIDETQLQGEILVQKRIAEAKLAMMFEQPLVALRALPPALDTLAPSLTIVMDELRASALMAAGRTRESVITRVALSERLVDPAEVEANEQAIWQALAGASDKQLQQWAAQTADPRLRGWLELAYITKTAPAELGELEQLISDWQTRFPRHPAAAKFIVQVMDEWRLLQLPAERLAVLLPLTGRYAKVANAILVGILAAHFTSARPSVLIVQVYDMGDQANKIGEIYQNAVNDGAEAVIGPLNKRAVAALADLAELPVPVLSLNYIDKTSTPPPNLYQFGLLPEDEARQVAERASLEGRVNAIVFVPEGQWGTRLLDAFRSRFEALGGAVLATERFEATGADFSIPIKRALLLDESETRFKTLKQTLQRQIKFEPRRRDDVDMVFIAASPRQARLLRPQFEFHYAGDLPIYATSHIYNGVKNPIADRDMDDIRYCDMPWTLDEENPAPDLKSQLGEVYPSSSQQYPRFVALGIDAYNLIPYLKRLGARPHERYAGLTGNLSVDAQHRVHRELRWARFEKGTPQILDSLTVARTRDNPGQ